MLIGVHNHSSISFINLKDKDVRVFIMGPNRIELVFSEVGFKRLGRMKDSPAF